MSFNKCLLAALMAGASLPAIAAPDNYTIDPTHTYPSLEFSHMGLSVWRGKFNKNSGKIVLDRAAKSGTVEVTIDVSSINFGLAAMDEKARSDDFFDTVKFPTATYKGKLKFVGDAPKAVDGQIQQMDQQIASADLQVAKAAAMPGAVQESRPIERNGMDDNVVPIVVVFTLFVLFPIALAFARRIWKRTSTVIAPISRDVQNRLEQIGQSVESIALEVERIGEGQRFMTKVMSESGRALGAGAAQPIPVQQADKLGAQQG